MPRNLAYTLAISLAFTSALASPLVMAEAVAADKPKAPQTALTSEFIYKYLVGEIAGQRGDIGLASSLFLDLAKSSRDPRLAERAAKAAVYGNKPKIAIQAVSLWAELAPDSLEAMQASTQMLVSAGKLNEAKPLLQKLLQKENTRANGFLYLNELLARQTDKNAVLAIIQELAKPYPSLPEARFTTAHAAYTAGKNELALSELNALAKLRPGWEMAALLQGQILYSQSPDSTLRFYQEFLSQNPNANEVRLSYARLLVNQKRLDEAKTEFVKLVKSSGDNPEVMVVVGLLSFQSGDYLEASNYFQQSLKAGFKDKDQIYQYLGQIAERQRNDTQALEWYNQIKPGERFLEAKLSIATVMARTQGVNAAINMLDNLQDLNSEQMALVIQTEASLLNQAKRYKEAFDLLEKAVTTLPNTPEIIYDYAMTAERVQRMDVMEKELRKLIQIKPDFAQAYNALGYTLADRNLKLDEAHKLIEKALTLSPNDHYILDSMGWVHYRLGKLDQAVDYLRRAYTTQTDPEIAAHLGEVLWQQGKRDEAIQTWNDALRSHPDNEVLLNTSKKFNP